MASSERRVPDYGRRIRWLGIFVVLLFGGYALAWFWVAGQLEARATEAIAEANRGGERVECANAEAGGFPFRIGLFCDRVRLADPREGLRVEAGAFRSAAQVYNPFLVVGELDGPARIEAPGLPPLDVSWEGLQTSVRVAQPLPERVSAEARQLSVSGPGGALASAADMQGHMRLNGADIDLAASFRDLGLAPALAQGRTLPKLAGAFNATVADGVAWAAAGGDSLRGREATLRSLRLLAGEGASLQLSGPVAVGADGLLDADLTLTVSGPDRIAAVLAEVFPERADQVRAAFAGLAALGPEPTLPLKVTDGQASLGFIPLGEVPPLR